MRCRVCANVDGNIAYEVREMMFGYGDRFTYHECAACGCLQIDEPPADMSRYYPPEYYSFATPKHVAPWRSQSLLGRYRDDYALSHRGALGRLLHALAPNTALDDAIAEWFPGQGRARLGLSRRSRILDVGCGAGALVRLLSDVGCEAVTGIDPYIDEAQQHPERPRILRAVLGDMTDTWDVIMFHHSFEHLLDGETTLGDVRRVLRPRGWCVIRIPTVSSWAWERYRVDWVQLDAPRHLVLHSRRSLSMLAERTGFVVDCVEDDSTTLQFIGSEQYGRGIPLCAARSYYSDPACSAFTPADVARYARDAATLNQTHRGDQAAFYLRAS